MGPLGNVVVVVDVVVVLDVVVVRPATDDVGASGSVVVGAELWGAAVSGDSPLISSSIDTVFCSPSSSAASTSFGRTSASPRRITPTASNNRLTTTAADITWRGIGLARPRKLSHHSPNWRRRIGISISRNENSVITAVIAIATANCGTDKVLPDTLRMIW